MRHRTPTRAFTMVEMVVTLAIMTLLISAMASAVVLAGRAVPDEDDLSIRVARGVEALDRLRADLGEAIEITETGDAAVEITVPDRGQEGDGPETIRYAWSGKAGDPLTLSLNGGTPAVVCADVHAFSIEYTYTDLPLNSAPRVMLIAGNKTSPSADDQDRLALLQSWGFPVEVFDGSDSLSELRIGEQNADVVYLTGAADLLGLFSSAAWVTDPVVSESAASNDDLGIASANFTLLKADNTITDTDHTITSPFPLGSFRVADGLMMLNYSSGLAPGARELASFDGVNSSLIAVDRGATLTDGSASPTRRVAMPWGDGLLFDFGLLTDDALTMLRRALVWAATPIGVRTVTVTMQVGEDAANTVEATITLHNLPGAP